MATVCKLGGGGASKKKINAAKRLEGAFIFSEGVTIDAQAGDGSRLRTKTVRCPSDSSSDYIVFFSAASFGNTSGDVDRIETNGTFIKTYSGNTAHDYRHYDSGNDVGSAYGIVLLKPGQYLDMITSDVGYYRAVATHAFIMTVPREDT